MSKATSSRSAERPLVLREDLASGESQAGLTVKPAFHWPTDTQRITVIGKTGSGKTQFAAWHLSTRSFTSKPWVVFDFKLDELLNQIPGTQELSVTAKAPRKPGLYLVHPNPDQTEQVDDLLWRIWERGNTGIYIDEGYMIPPRSPSFQAVLTQGRSKRIPVIMLTQRPTWVTRFAFSEADYISLFTLNDRRDIKVVQQFMPMPIENRLPDAYYSWWYDNARNVKAVLKPVPDRDRILDLFHARLIPQRRKL
jgi:hypothetical protein